jgi:acyl dehydratase
MPTVYFEDLDVGSVHLGRECTCDRDEMLEFSRRNDPWPFHVDEAAAAQSPFGGLSASGGYIINVVVPLSDRDLQHAKSDLGVPGRV